MMKARLTFAVSCLMLVGASFPVRADIEFLQQAQEYMGYVQNEMSYVQYYMSQAQELQRMASEGVGNAMQKINEAQTNPLGVGEELLNTTPSDIVDINNISKASGQVTKSYNAQTGKGKDIEVSQKQYDKMMDIQRENLANLYAVAFTTRSLLAKERTKEQPENNMEDTRELVKLTNKKAAEMARRMRNILKLEAATYEYMTSQAAIAYSSEEKKEEGEETDSSGGEK